MPQPIPQLRDFDDARATRTAVYDNVFNAASTLPPVSNARHTLKLTNVAWGDEGRFTKSDRKKAVLTGGTLGRKLVGTWELSDNASGQVLDRKRTTVARVPHLNEAGTFVHNGTEYAVRLQQRLKPGVFTRLRENGEIEAHANVLSGGPGHRYFLDPAKGVFYLRSGQAKIPALPLLQSLGATDSELRQAWGDDLFNSNFEASDGAALGKLASHFGNQNSLGQPEAQRVRQAFENMKLDPAVTTKTLGQPHAALNKEAVLAITRKLLDVSRGKAEVDDRDHLAYQTFLGPEDLFAERLAKDYAGLRRKLLFKASGKSSLKGLPAAALQDQLDSVLLGSGLGQSIEESNPVEILDKNTQLTRMGEGGIADTRAIPEEARMVQGSHLGFVDAARTVESERVGVDVYLARNARKGPNGQIYGKFLDPAGQPVWKTPQEIADAVVGFPGFRSAPGKRVLAMRNGRMVYVPKAQVQLEAPPFEHSFSPIGNLVPLKSMVKAQRTAMGSRMVTQALPLLEPEAPLVQAAVPGTNGMRSFDEELSRHAGALRASQDGRVVSVGPQTIKVRYANGQLADIDLYNHHPHNRRTHMTQTPVVQPGQSFTNGQLLARSNFTDANGTMAMGRNLRVAFVPWAGKNYEDAILLSESAAKKLRSEHLYQHQLEMHDRMRPGKSAFISLFPGKYDHKTLANLDANGLVKPGTVVQYGDPLVLGAEQRAAGGNRVHRKGQPGFHDASVTWQKSDPGIVVDVVPDAKGGPLVTVKSVHAMQVGDKLAGRHGNKGVVSGIIADEQMPHDQGGKPFELLLNPLGTISRGNPAQIVEAALGKLAEQTGQPIKVEDFDPRVPDRAKWAMNLLQQHGLSDTEDIIDPASGRKIPGVQTGKLYVMKLHHMAESKEQARSGGSYSSESEPAKGTESGAKRLSLLETSALLSHGAPNVLRDAHLVRGQRNDDYWLQFMSGHAPRQPKVPLVYQKFVDQLKAAGINVIRNGSQTHVMALTNRDVNKLAGDREIQSGQTLRLGNSGLEPIAGGLFDEKLVGRGDSGRWSAIRLTEPMPSPVFEEPIRRVLGMTAKKFEDVIAGKEHLYTGTGPSAIAQALDRLDLDKELAIARAEAANGPAVRRDAAIRRLGYLKSAKEMGLHPRDWVLHRVPVLPPQFRPVSLLGSKNIPLVADPNLLYRELIEANDNLRHMNKQVGEDQTGNERLALYHAFKGVVGLGDPITRQNQDRQVRGLLKSIFGSTGKFSFVQRKLLSLNVDNVGRAVIVPNPDLDLDQIGLPEEGAFQTYQRFVVRRLRRAGMPITEALKQVRDKSPLARKALLEEMEQRPVIASRAPVLHRFGIMAFRPVLVKGSVMQLPPQVYKGFGADNDGDMMNYHVPVDDKAVHEAMERMLPSRQLLAPADFKTPVQMATQEYVAGAHHLSTAKNKRTPRIFRNRQDVVRAWKAGEISAGDPVQVMEP